MNIKTLVVGQMAVNCYFLTDPKSKNTLVIDPGDEANYLSQEIEKEGLKPIAILATHGHFDHILGALELQLMYNIPFRLNKKDEFLLSRMKSSAEYFLGRNVTELPPTVTETLEDEEKIRLGDDDIQVIATPGHTPGSMSLYVPSEHSVLVGDLLFAAGGVGRTDFAYSSQSDLQTSIQKILALPHKTTIYAGHGESTSISSTINLWQ